MVLYIIWVGSIAVVIYEIKRIVDLIRKKNIQEDHFEFIASYPIFILFAVISLLYTLSTNYIFLNFIDVYRIESYPECTLYCYVEEKTDKSSIMYPCKVIKYKDEDNHYYYDLSSVFLQDCDLDLTDEDIQLYPDKYVKFENMQLKLVNIKYKNSVDISEGDIFNQYFGIIVSFIYLIFIIDCFVSLIKKLRKYRQIDDKYKLYFGNFHHPITNESIWNAESYIDAVMAQDKIKSENNN